MSSLNGGVRCMRGGKYSIDGAGTCWRVGEAIGMECYMITTAVLYSIIITNGIIIIEDYNPGRKIEASVRIISSNGNPYANKALHTRLAVVVGESAVRVGRIVILEQDHFPMAPKGYFGLYTSK